MLWPPSTRGSKALSTSSYLSKRSSVLYSTLIISLSIIILLSHASHQQQTFSSSAISLNRVSALISWNSDGITLKASSSVHTDESQEDNCFYWSTLNPDLVSLVPVSNGQSKTELSDDESSYGRCSQEIQVIPKGFNAHKKVAIVTAQRKSDSSSAQCEVFIDSIHQLKLQTTVRKLVVGELETLQVDGFDTEGNIFSSLTGLKFKWKSEGVEGVNRAGAIELIDVNDSSVHILQEKKLLRRGSNDEIVAKGILVGEASITVSLQDKLADTVHIFVLDSFVLEPRNMLRVIPGTIIPYKLFMKTVSSLNQNKLEPVVMPSSRFGWLSSNHSVGEIDSNTGVFKAIDIGDTHVFAQDKTFAMNKATALVHVVRPAFVKLKISPLKKKLYRGYEYVLQKFGNSKNSGHSSLVLENDYKVDIELYDEQNLVIDITENVKFKFSVESSLSTSPIEILKRSPNENSFEIRASHIGSAVLKVSLNSADLLMSHYGGSFSTHNENIELTHSKPIAILPRVQMKLPNGKEGETIYLPVDNNVRQEYKVLASGGSEELMWSGIDTASVLDIHEKSGIMITKGEGEAEIVVFDYHNLYNGDSRKVSVSVPAALRFIRGVREVSLDETLCLQLEGLDSKGNAFHAISALQIEWNVLDTAIYSTFSSMCGENDPSYASKSFKALSEGFTTVKIRYQNGRLQERTFIAVYPRLHMTEPFNNQTKVFLIPLGATATLTFEGGPQPWDRFVKGESVITDRLTAEEPDNLKIAKIQSSASKKRSFAITCLDFGSQKLTVEIKHRIPTEDAFPSMTSVNVLYSCQKPERIEILPLDPKSQKELTTINKNEGLVRIYSVRNNQVVPAKMNVYDKLGNQFVTISSLHDTWEVSDNTIATVSPNQQAPGYRLLDISDKEGVVRVQGQIIGYLKDELKKHVSYSVMNQAISSFTPLSDLQDEIELRVTSNVFVTPTNYLLFRSRKVTLNVKASGGSGRYDYSLNDTHIASLNPKGNTAEVTGLVAGYVKVNVADSYLTSSPSAECFVKVADISHVNLEGEHYVQEDNSITIKFNIFDDLDTLFPTEQYIFMQPKIEPDTTGIVAIKSPENSTDNLPNEYTIFGLTTGTVKLIASVVTADGKRLFSTPFIVNVYGPLRVDPPELYLIPGATFQVKVTGGPIESQRVSTVFRFEKDTIAQVDQRGVVTGLNYGEEMLVVRKVSSSQPDVVYASKTVPVFVVQLIGIKIPSPLSLFENNHIPVSVYGVFTTSRSRGNQLLSPLFMQSPYYKVTIESADNKVTDVYNPYSTTGHSAFILGNKIGKSQYVVSASFTGHPFLSSLHFTTKSDVQVDDKLRLIDYPHKDLILAPKSSTFHLRTNKDNLSVQKYTVAKTEEYDNVVYANKNGKITTRDVEGISIVIIEEVVSGQTVAQKVSVQNPHYMAMYMSQTGAPTYDFDFKVPIGSDFEIPLAALSVRGDKFVSTSGIDISIRMNYHDIISAKINVDHETVVIYGNNVGTVTLELSAPELREPYYCRVSVVSTVETVSSNVKMHIGDTIDLASIASSGNWESDDESVVQVDNKNNLLVAIKPGNAKVVQRNAFKARQFTSLQVNVVRASNARILSNNIVLSASDPAKQSPIRLPLQLLDNNNQELLFATDSRVKKNFIVECQSPIYWIDVVATEKRGDKYECLIKPNRESFLSGELSRLSSSQDLYLTVRVKYGDDQVKHYSLTTPSISAKLTSAQQSSQETKTQPSRDNVPEDEESGGYLIYVILSLIIGVLGFVVYGSLNNKMMVRDVPRRNNRARVPQPQEQYENDGMNLLSSTLLMDQKPEIPYRSSSPTRFTHSQESRFNQPRSTGKQSSPFYANPYMRSENQRFYSDDSE